MKRHSNAGRIQLGGGGGGEPMVIAGAEGHYTYRRGRKGEGKLARKEEEKKERIEAASPPEALLRVRPTATSGRFRAPTGRRGRARARSPTAAVRRRRVDARAQKGLVEEDPLLHSAVAKIALWEGKGRMRMDGRTALGFHSPVHIGP